MIACFLSNISAKYYRNPAMLSRVIAKNVGDVFFETQCIFICYTGLRPYIHFMLFVHTVQHFEMSFAPYISVTSCRGTALPGIENYTQANKFYWTCLEEGSVRRSCTDRKNRG